MTYLQAIVLGLIQGLTEFLPVSSSGHLIFVPKLLGWADQGVGFDLFLHLGTLVAVVWFFRVRLWSLLKAACSRQIELKNERTLAWTIAFSAIPAAIAGLLLETNDRNALVVGANLILWGLVLGAADWYARKRKPVENTPPIKNIVAMSVAQTVALIPGTSRSGITMTTGLFSGLTRAQAAEISFLMSVPITALAGADALVKTIEAGVGDSAGTLLIGFLAAALSGVVAIKFLLKIVQRWSFMPFVVYRVLIGILILWVLL